MRDQHQYSRPNGTNNYIYFSGIRNDAECLTFLSGVRGIKHTLRKWESWMEADPMGASITTGYLPHRFTPNFFLLSVKSSNLYFRIVRTWCVYSEEANCWGRRWCRLLMHSDTRLEVAGSIPDMALAFFIDLILPTALWSWFRPFFWHKWVLGLSARV